MTIGSDMYICPECNEIIGASSKEGDEGPEAKYCSRGHAGRFSRSYLRGVITGLKVALLLTALFSITLSQLFGNVDKWVFLSIHILGVIIAGYFIARGLMWWNKGGPVRSFAPHSFGLATGFVGFVALVDWLVMKYH